MTAKTPVTQAYTPVSDPLATTCHYGKMYNSHPVGKAFLWLLWSSLDWKWWTCLQTLLSYPLICTSARLVARICRETRKTTGKTVAKKIQQKPAAYRNHCQPVRQYTIHMVPLSHPVLQAALRQVRNLNRCSALSLQSSYRRYYNS